MSPLHRIFGHISYRGDMGVAEVELSTWPDPIKTHSHITMQDEVNG